MREAVSAAIDGEDPGGDLAGVLRHQVSCAECAAWSRSCHDLARRTRLAPAEEVPDLTERIVTAVVADRRVSRRRRQVPTRLALVAVALGQLLLTGPYLVLGRDHAAPEHLARELGSFGVAVSLGLLVAAARPALAAGSLPVLGAAGGLLAVTAALDVAAGRADVAEELPHLLPALGVLLLCRLLLTWAPPADDGGDPGRLAAANLGGRALVRWAPHQLARGRHARIDVLRARPPLRRRARSLGSALLLAAGLGIAAAGPASAHATLESATPSADVVLGTAPKAVLLHFDEPVSVPPGGVQVVAPDGTRVDDGVVTHPGGGSNVSVGLRGTLARGSYLVAYRVVSADSHPVSGAYVFSVGATSNAADASALQTSSNRPLGLVLGAGRFLAYLGLVLALGGLGFLLTCWPTGWDRSSAHRLLVGGWVALAVGTAVGLLGKGAYDAGRGLGDIGRPSLVREVLHTPFGRALALRVVVLALVVLWWNARTTWGRADRGRRPWWALGAALAIGLLLTFAQAGHANSGGQRVLAFLSDGLHLTAMSLWLGGLATLALLVLHPASVDDPASAVTRFSRIAATSVLVLVATGTYQAWRQVGSTLDAVPATTYGRLLLVKVGLVSMVLLAAAASRAAVRSHYRPLPVVHASVEDDVHAASTDDDTPSGPEPLSVLRRSVAAEAVLATAVLGVTAALVAVQPAKSAYHPSVDERFRLGPLSAEVTAVPFGDKVMSMHIYTTDRSGSPVTPPEVTARASLPAQRLGPLAVKLEPAGAGHWAASIAVPVRGDWQLKVSARTSEIDVYSSSVTLPIR